MRALRLAGLRRNPTRFVATALAIVVATAFLAAVLTLRDSVGAALRDSAEVGLDGVDAAVLPDPRTAGVLAYLEAPTLPPEVVEAVAAVPGVAAADGTVTGPVALLADDGIRQRDGMVGAKALDPPTLGPYQPTAGRLPAVAGEVALDEETAEDEGIAVGDRVRLGTSDGPQEAEVVGIVRWADRPSSGGAGDVVVAPPDATAWLAAGRPGVTAVLVQAAEGRTDAEIVTDLQAALGGPDGPDVVVLSGDEHRRREAGAAAELVDVLGTGLQVFAYVALVVGAFIIANTFTITVAQRTRELGLLRAVGATPAQVRRMVRTEALVVGVGASAAGWAVGVVLFAIAASTVPAIRSLAGGPTGVVVVPTSVLQVVVSGTVVALLAAVVPAWRASRVRPVEALSAAAVDRSANVVVRNVLGALAIGAGVLGLLASSASLVPGVVALLAPMALVLGLVLAGPALAGVATGGLARVAPFGGHPVVGLAVANAHRNPRRTSATANALLLGVFLVVFVTSAGGAVRDYVVAQLTATATADLTVRATTAALPPGLRDEVTALPAVAGTAAVEDGVARTTLAGSPTPVSAGDPDEVAAVRGLTAVEGRVTGLARDEAVVPDIYAQAGGVKVGDPMVVTFADGAQREVTVVGTTRFSLASLSPFITDELVREATGELVPNVLEVQAEPGRIGEARAALEAVAAGYANVVVEQGSELGDAIEDAFNGIISSVDVLLGVAVVIALFGIVNTLVLSIAERGHEIGLLRAVGMSRAQLARSIRVEAVVVALLGTLLGAAAGLLTGWAVTQPLLDESLVTAEFSWPVAELAVVLVLGVALGVVAAAVPARRAARTEVMEALRSE